jgi:hypothetical protein
VGLGERFAEPWSSAESRLGAFFGLTDRRRWNPKYPLV